MVPAMAWEYSTGFRLQPTVLTFSAIAFVTIFSTIFTPFSVTPE